MSSCSARKANGEPCKRTATPGSDVCWHHDPSHAKTRKAVASSGGRGRAETYRTRADAIVEVQNEIKNLIDKVLAGNIDKSKASVAIQGYGVLKGYLEQERKQREYDELLPRLDALEDAARREAESMDIPVPLDPPWLASEPKLELPRGMYE